MDKEAIKEMIREELDQFLEDNSQLMKMMRSQATSDAYKAAATDSVDAQQAQKDKAFRKAQGGQGGTRELELEEKDAAPKAKKTTFPKTTPPKTSEKSSKMISKAVKSAKDKKDKK